jgi:hypothetical protein
MAELKSFTDVLDPARYEEDGDLDDDCQVTVWEPDENNGVHVWFENADGDCSYTFNPDERRRLIAHLQKGL